MTQTNESPAGAPAPNRARTHARVTKPIHGTAAQQACATIERRFAGIDSFDPEQVAKELDGKVALIAQGERQRLVENRRRLRAERQALDPVRRLLDGIERLSLRGGA